jgi:hypothetical protein
MASYGNRSFSLPPPPLLCLAKSPKSAHAHWVVGKCDNLERALSLRNVLHLPTTKCACAKQRNGSSGREKDLGIQDLKICQMRKRYAQNL